MMMRLNFLHKIIQSTAGAGLVLVLIVCSLVGAAAIYVLEMGAETEKKVVGDSRVLSYNSLVENVRSQLHSGSACTDLLRGLDISGAFNPNGQSISLNLQLKMNPKVLKKPVGKDVWFVKGGTSVQDVLLNVYEKVREPVRLDNSVDPPLVAAMAYVLIVPGHKGVGIKLARNKRYKIPIFLYYSRSGASKILHSCFNPSGDAYFCTVNNGAYDARSVGLPQNQRCQPDRDCIPFNGAGIVTTPSACPSPYKANSLGFNTTENRHDLYWCNWCNRNSLQPEAATGIYYLPPTGVSPPEPDSAGKYPPVVAP